MEPPFTDADKVIVTKTTGIERFDQIIFDAPDAEEKYIKRVIGMPGDSMKQKMIFLYVNGEEIAEPYLDEHRSALLPGQKLMGDFTLMEVTGYDTVPDGYLFVLGDNRLVSKDSRSFGLIREDSVIGEVQLQFYPFTAIKIY